MATAITNSTQLDIFDEIKIALLKSPTISGKFKSNNFYEFEPTMKDIITKSTYPYIVIKVPELETSTLTIDDVSTKNPTVIITMVLEWEARNNFRTYANAIIDMIETHSADFEPKGYYKPDISTDSTTDNIDSKQFVVGIFTVNFMGYISR